MAQAGAQGFAGPALTGGQRRLMRLAALWVGSPGAIRRRLLLAQALAPGAANPALASLPRFLQRQATCRVACLGAIRNRQIGAGSGADGQPVRIGLRQAR